jgi:hypothetical protein
MRTSRKAQSSIQSWRAHGLSTLQDRQDSICQSLPLRLDAKLVEMKIYAIDGHHKHFMYTTVDVIMKPAGEIKSDGRIQTSRKKMMIFVKDINRDLESEIEFRRSQPSYTIEYFPESDKWYTLESIIDMECNMAMNSRVHGDIRPNYRLTSESGFIKFNDSNILDANMSSFCKTVNNIQKCPLPPESLLLLKNRSYKLSDLSKSDVFAKIWSIGIILVCIADLTEADYYYDWTCYRLRLKKLQESMERVKYRYSPLLFTIIQACLADNPKSRCSVDSFGRLWQPANHNL